MLGRLVDRTWHYDPSLYAPARYRRACGYQAFIPNPLTELRLDLPGTLAGVVSAAEDAVRSLNAAARPALAPLARLLLRTESIASSKVEGMQVDARTLARAEAKAGTGGKVSPAALEVLANIDAMILAVEEATTDEHVQVARIIDVHKALMVNAHNSNLAGRIRAEQNWIGGNDYNPCGADFVPPPHEEVGHLLDDLCAFCNENELPPLVQAAVAHAQFETIHPFTDGNGRTGRALVHVLLRRRALSPSYVPPISVVLAKSKERYIEGLTAYRSGNVNTWLEQFAVATAQAAALAEQYLREVRTLQGRWRADLRSSPQSPRSDAAAWAVIDQLPGHSIVTVPVLVAATGRSKPAIGQAVDQLTSAGILVAVSGGARNRAWEAVGLLDLLSSLDDS
ncbi:MAG TPA: Fic family protein [Acidimicrobiales bacterium]|nr:Fic family protein [Acidimicrobiales bacterium]